MDILQNIIRYSNIKYLSKGNWTRLMKILRKILKNDIRNNNRHFEIVFLKKLIYVWYN